MELPNLKYLEELADGDKDFEIQFLSILKSEFPQERYEYLNYLEKEDFLEASLLVHKLKHKLNVLGLSKGYHLAITHEENLKNGDTSLVHYFFTILDTIETYLKDI